MVSYIIGVENNLIVNFFCRMETIGTTLGWAGAAFLPIWFAGPIVGPLLAKFSPVIGWITGKGLEELLKWKYCSFGEL